MDSTHIKKALEIAFTSENEADNIRYVTTEELKKIGDGAEPVEVMKVTVTNPGEEAAFIEKVLRAYGLVPVLDIDRREHASYGTLEFTNDPNTVDAQFPDELNAEMASVLDDDEDEPVEVAPKTRAEIARDSLETISDESKLKVINNPEMMKMANKIFDMISPGDDKSNYAAFLYNLDDFFLVHQPEGGIPNEDDEEEDDDAPVERDPLAGGGGSELASTEAKDFAYLLQTFGNVEMAASFLANIEAFTPAAELAKKKKNPRSAVLSILMKAMSGEHGIAAVNAFEGQNVENFKNSMDQVAASVTSKVAGMFEEEKNSEEE